MKLHQDYNLMNLDVSVWSHSMVAQYLFMLVICCWICICSEDN